MKTGKSLSLLGIGCVAAVLTTVPAKAQDVYKFGISAGLTGYAIGDVLREIRATPHTEEFARAAENGAILLWVRAEDPDSQAKAVDLLGKHGAYSVHTHERPKQEHDGG